MWTKIRAVLHYARERWIYLLVILVLLLMLQFLVSMTWINKNGTRVRMSNFFESSRLTDLFRVDRVNTQQWIRESSPFWSSNGSRNRSLSSSITDSDTDNALPLCPLIPNGLVGPIALNMTEVDFLSLESRFKELEPGGHYKPPNCRSRHKVAIIIPYRNREKHLKIFLNNMHPFLQKQQLEYGIYVVEQKTGTTFNRAMLMNIGFVEAMKQFPYECHVFHDVDLLPEDDRNIYSCPEQPRHLSVAVDIFAYKLPYAGIFGGANEMRTEHFRKVNGFSNKFWGWGGEDDDMSSRVRDSGLHITRYPVNIARYRMIHHQRDKGNPVNPRRFDLMRQGLKRFNMDGLNTLKYDLLKVEKRKLYTLVYVDVNERNS